MINGYDHWQGEPSLSRLYILVLAASETCKTRQVPALNPIKPQSGYAEPELYDVNAQNLSAFFCTLLPVSILILCVTHHRILQPANLTRNQVGLGLLVQRD